jgi:hypothetical protein
MASSNAKPDVGDILVVIRKFLVKVSLILVSAPRFPNVLLCVVISLATGSYR